MSLWKRIKRVVAGPWDRDATWDDVTLATLAIMVFLVCYAAAKEWYRA